MRISDWSSDVCSSDLLRRGAVRTRTGASGAAVRYTATPDRRGAPAHRKRSRGPPVRRSCTPGPRPTQSDHRSEEHTSELQSLMRISYAVFCLKKKKQNELIQRPTRYAYNTDTN